MTTNVKKSDATPQHAVQEELIWEPSIDAAAIGVAVEDGVVTRTGGVNHYFEKWQAQAAARRVAGVKAVANDVQVHIIGEARHADPDIARAAAEALARSIAVPPDRVAVSVSDGWITGPARTVGDPERM